MVPREENVGGCFYLNQKNRKFRNGEKWYENFLETLPENPEIVEFSKKPRTIQTKIR